MKKTILIAKLKSFLILIVIALALTFVSCPEEVVPKAPTITTETLPNGVVGTAYSQTLTATGDTPITWSIDTGTLPDGLTLTEGVITGTPTTVGSSSFTVKAENDVANDTKTFSIIIDLNGPRVWTAVANSTIWDYKNPGNGWTDKAPIRAIAYGIADGESVGRFVAGGLDGKTAYSDDNGVTWTAVPDNPTFIRPPTYVSYDINAIAYGIADGESVGRFVAVGESGRMAFSDDGVSWTAVSDRTAWSYGTSGTSYRDILGIAYGIADGESVGRFVAVGQEGKMAYSDDGITWTAVSNSTFGTTWIYGIAYGNNRFVAGGYNGAMAYSDDNGVTWTAVADSTFGTSTIIAIAYGNNRFVAVGESGKMAYSDDNGVTWTAVADSTFPATYTSGSYTSTYQIRAIAYRNNRFVAGGSSGKMAYSVDGVTWTAISDSTFGTNSILAIAYGNNRFVAVGVWGRMAYADWTGE